MEGLLLLVILVPVIFLFLILILLSRIGEQRRLLEALYDKFGQLGGEISSLTNELRQQKAPAEMKPVPPVTVPEPPVVRPAAATPPPVEVPEPPVAIPTPVSITIEEKITVEIKQEPIPEPSDAFKDYAPYPEETSKRDIEKFIGENLANKIGIAILVLGIAFFIKFAIDKDWINETGRVIIGLICGAILMGFAHYLRNTYRSFSSVLVGGGLSVFYFSVAFAFHQYGLISQTAAFIYMVVISGLGVVLSLYYKRQELAILATIGAFITPFLVSTGKENYIALFTYICIVNAGLMALAWFKRWPAINSIALFFTTIIFGGWITRHTLLVSPSTLPLKDALLFASLFYLQFVTMNILNTIRLKNKFTAFDFIVLLGVNLLYYLSGMLILDFWTEVNYNGLFTALLGVFNLLLAILFYRKKSVDRNFVHLLVALGLSYISLVAPVQFKGNHIVLFWAAEAVILLWLSQRTRMQLLAKASLVVLLAMLVSAFSNWAQQYGLSTVILPIIINKGFITGIVVSVSLFIYCKLLYSDSDPLFSNPANLQTLRRATLIAAITITFLTGLLEIAFQFNSRYPELPLANAYIQAYSYASAILLLWIFRRDNSFPVMKFLFTCLCFAVYLSSTQATYEASIYLLGAGKGFLFLGHWVAVLLLLWLLYDLIVFFFRQQTKSWQDYSTAFTWIAAIGIVVVLSIELYHVNLWAHYPSDEWLWWENLYFRAGLSILWGLCSFAMMWLGMKKTFKPLRIISLTLFTVTLIKLFSYDIVKVPAGGKIAAFILLGVLLLAISFMYQRLKRIILENDAGS